MKPTDKEQKHVRTALRFLRLHAGGWATVAKSLRVKIDTLDRVVRGRRSVTGTLAYSVARVAEVPIDDLLAGTTLSPRTCPHCGHPPADFEDEETVVEDQPREAVLKLVR